MNGTRGSDVGGADVIEPAVDSNLNSIRQVNSVCNNTRPAAPFLSAVRMTANQLQPAFVDCPPSPLCDRAMVAPLVVVLPLLPTPIKAAVDVDNHRMPGLGGAPDGCSRGTPNVHVANAWTVVVPPHAKCVARERRFPNDLKQKLQGRGQATRLCRALWHKVEQPPVYQQVPGTRIVVHGLCTAAMLGLCTVHGHLCTGCARCTGCTR